MAQAVWNRYCGQQHKRWICQESWHCVQHICNCNLAPTRSNSKQPLRNNIFFFSSPPFLFLKKLREVSSDDSVLLIPASWQTGNSPLCACAPTQQWKIQQLLPMSLLGKWGPLNLFCSTWGITSGEVFSCSKNSFSHYNPISIPPSQDCCSTRKTLTASRWGATETLKECGYLGHHFH